MLKDCIWQYISNRFDDDGVLPDADEIYLRFQMHFDNGAELNLIDEIVYNFTRSHDLKGIEILFEGEIYERSLAENC